MKTISVIIPVYHTPGMALERCVKSIIEQTYTNLEILIVDDGNPESYQHHFDTLEMRDPRIKVIHRPNSGVSEARNQGIRNSTGEYISFVDSDDYLDCAFYTKMEKAITGNDLAICGVGDSSYPTGKQWCDRRYFFSKPTQFNMLQYVNFPVNKLFRASIIKEFDIRFPLNVRLGEDALFLVDYYAHCKTMQIIPDLLYHYIYSPSSAVHSYQPEYWNWEKEVIQKQWDMFHQYPLTENETQAMLAWLYFKYRGAAYYYLDNELDKRKVRKYVAEIVSFPLLEELKKVDFSANNKYLSSREKKSVRAFNTFGTLGTELSYLLRKKQSDKA